MSDDKKDVLDGIDLSFDDDFDKEVEASLSEKTAMESSGDIGDEKPDEGSSHSSMDLVENADQTEVNSPDESPVSEHTDIEIGGHDTGALEDKSLELGADSIDSIELGSMIADSSEDIGARTEDVNSEEENDGNANIQELFADVSEDLSGGVTESLKDSDIESATEAVNSEEIEMGAAQVPEKTQVRDKKEVGKKEIDSSHEKSLEPEPTKKNKKRRRKKGGLTSDALIKIIVVLVLLTGGAVYMVFFTNQGLFGLSLKKPESKSRLDKAAEEAANLTPELLQQLDQKYEQAQKYVAMDGFAFYQKAIGIYNEILTDFSNHPHASSGLASATLMGGDGYIRVQDFKQVHDWIRHADTVSPNTQETLRAKIRFLMFQNNFKEARARLDQMQKVGTDSIPNHILAAELALQMEDFDLSAQHLAAITEIDADYVRAQFFLAQLEFANGEKEKAVGMYQILMVDKTHMPSAVAYYQYKHVQGDQEILEPLNQLIAEQGKSMSPNMLAKCYKMLSDIFAAKGNEEKSIATLELAVAQVARNDVYAYELGLKYENQKSFGKSTKLFEQAHQIKPGNHLYTVAYARNLRFVGKSKEAEALLKPVLESSPDLESAIVQYAESRADQGFYDDVIAYLQTAIEKKPHFVDVQNLLGLLYIEQNQFRKAGALLSRSVKQASAGEQKAKANRLLGILALKQEKYDLALTYLQKSNKDLSQHTRTLFALGKAYYYKGQYQQSEQYIIDALNIDGLNYEARGILAQIYFDKGKPEEAKKVISEILEDDPKNVSLRVTLGKMLIEQGQYIEAIDHLDEAYLYDSENYETYYYLGIAERESGKVDVSVRSFSKAIDIWDESHNAYYQRGLTFIRKNDIKNASLDMRKANEIKPRWTLPNKAIAKYYYEVSKYDKAAQQFQTIVDVNPKDQEALFYLGKSYFYQEKTKQALAQFSRLLKINPQDPKAHYEIGVIYEDAGDFPRAYDFLAQAKKRDPKNPSVHYHMGFVLKNLNRRKQAAASFETYLQLDPKTIEKEEIEDEIYRLLHH